MNLEAATARQLLRIGHCIISCDANLKTNVKLSKPRRIPTEFYVGGTCREAVAVSLTTFGLSDETEEAVCLSAKDEGSFVDGIRRILRILFTNLASGIQLVNMVSRGCKGKFGRPTMAATVGFCFITFCFLGGHEISSSHPVRSSTALPRGIDSVWGFGETGK